jgi:hypothetical protein
MSDRLPIRNFAARTLLVLVCLHAILSSARDRKRAPADPISIPQIELPEGRKLLYERSFSSEREVKLKRGFWTKVLDLVAGAPEVHNLVRPYGVVADSRGRVIVTDPGIPAIHVFDF